MQIPLKICTGYCEHVTFITMGIDKINVSDDPRISYRTADVNGKTYGIYIRFYLSTSLHNVIDGRR